MIGLSSAVLLISSVTYAVHTPECTHPGLGSFAFARRYLRNHFCFLFLRLLRCFSSPGSLCTPMDSVHSDQGLLGRVSPFRYLRIDVYLPLPAAFRSLSRLSSALSAKASTLRSFRFFLTTPPSVASLCPDRFAMTPSRMKAGFHPFVDIALSTLCLLRCFTSSLVFSDVLSIFVD